MSESETAERPPATVSTVRRWTRIEVIALLAIVLVAAVVRLAGLADPKEFVFDEIYYAKDSCFYIETSQDICQVDGHQAEVHPPLGKWFIAAGIGAFGFDSFGWRIGPAIAGVVTVLLMFLVARELFGSLLGAVLAAALLAFDPLHFVQSRTSMLDVFIPLFGLAAVLFLLYDRKQMQSPDPPATHRFVSSPWRAAAGAAAGCALATKWSGAFILVAVVVLAVAWEVRRVEDRRELRRQLASLFLWLVVLPLVIYVGSYAGQIEGSVFTLPWKEGSWGRSFFDQQRYMYDFHRNLEATHSYQSPGWSWILIKRPVSYFFCAGDACKTPTPDGDYREIFATGSPLVWWTSLLAVIGVAVAWVRRRDPRGPEGVILAGFAFTYGPWLLPMFNRSAVFIFYLLPTVPFMILAVVYVFLKLGESWEARAAIGVFTAGALGLFAFYYPLLTKRSLPQPQWQKRIWIFDNCDKPAADISTERVTVTEGGTIKVSNSETNESDSLPPTGWCWI